FMIDCFQVRHRDTDSYGFVLETPPRRHLRAEHLTSLGVPDGPIRKELVEGRSITLVDGRTVAPEDVLGPLEAGKKLVIIGDTESTDGLHVCGADLLVIEATFLERDATMARDYGHLTAAQAASLAAISNVKQLVLTHISGRYADEDILAEAVRAFPNSRIAADLDVLTV
ncbi:MAG: ribonuclease Z, partial [Mesorhizobium sp.]